ncbi:MAG: TetR/AcrR family transcriptional regulator [Treponema sp.]|nr:TetR/AcrR family transcriptional regulator [Treponema sp.]
MKQKTITTEMTKTYIAQSLILLMQKKPYTDISIGEITAKAGVNRSTYYRNFSSKEDIVKFYINKIHHEYRHIFNKNEPYKIHLEKLLTHFLKYKKEFILIYKNGLAHLILETLNGFYKPLMKDKTISLEEQVKFWWYTGAIYNSFLWWISNEMWETPKELSDIFEVILSNICDYEFLKQPFLVTDEQLLNIE